MGQASKPRNILIIGGTDVAMRGEIDPIAAGVNTLLHAIRQKFVSFSGNMTPHVDTGGGELSASYFAPAPFNTPAEIDKARSERISDDSPFHVRELEAHAVPMPAIGAEAGGKGRPLSFPYLLLHQFLAIDRVVRNESIEAHDANNAHTVLHAHTMGSIGNSIRRIAIRRSFPLVVTHNSQFLRLMEEGVAALLEAARNNLLPPRELFSTATFRDFFPFVASNPELLGPFHEIVSDIQTAGVHLLRKHHPWTASLGRLLLWIAQKLNPYVYDKVEAGKAITRVYQNLQRTTRWFGDRYDILDRLHRETSDPLRVAAQFLTRRYASWFYHVAQAVVVASERERLEVRELGVPSNMIHVAMAESPSVHRDVYSIACMADLQHKEETTSLPHTLSLKEFEWQEKPAGFPEFRAFCTISDLHLADGDSFERMEALTELFTLLNAKGVNSIVYNGDLGELSASEKKYRAHRDRMNWVRRSCLQGVPQGNIPTVVEAEVYVADLEVKQLSQAERDKIVRQLTKASARAGISLRVNGNRIGMLESISARPPNDQDSGRIPMEETFTVGNHDKGLDLEKEFPGMIPASSLVHFDSRMGAAFTHGHILGLAEFFKSIEQANFATELVEALKEIQLREALEMQEVLHDVATHGWRSTERAVDSRWLWKHALQPLVSSTVLKLRRHRQGFARLDKAASESVRFWESLVSPADDAERCGMLAAAFHTVNTPCWIACYGHSHVPSIDKVRFENPRTGRVHTKVVVNSGKFHGDLITATIVNFPEVTIFHWSQKDAAWRLHMYERLTDVEMAEVLDSQGISPRVPVPLTQKTKEPIHEGVVLHEVPTEGDGHITRFEALYSEYIKRGAVGTVLSGPRSQAMDLPGGVDYRCTGLRLHYSEEGGLDSIASATSYLSQIRDVSAEARQLASLIPNFQAIVSDFGPTLRLAYDYAREEARAQRKLASFPELYSVSHQAALESHQQNVPRPAPSPFYDIQQHVIDMLRGTRSIGFHYEEYNSTIRLPLIRPEVAKLVPTFSGNFVLTYVRGQIERLLSLIAEVDLPVEWRIYSSHVQVEGKAGGNTWLFRPNRKQFLEDLRDCQGVFTDAGFGMTSECLFLGLPFVARPVPNQFEQQANGAALRHISDVGLVDDLSSDATARVLLDRFGAHRNERTPLRRTGLMGPIRFELDVARRVVDEILCAKPPIP